MMPGDDDDDNEMIGSKMRFELPSRASTPQPVANTDGVSPVLSRRALGLSRNESVRGTSSTRMGCGGNHGLDIVARRAQAMTASSNKSAMVSDAALTGNNNIIIHQSPSSSPASTPRPLPRPPLPARHVGRLTLSRSQSVLERGKHSSRELTPEYRDQLSQLGYYPNDTNPTHMHINNISSTEASPLISGSAMEAVAVRRPVNSDKQPADAAALRRPLVRALTIASIRRKRTLEKLRQEEEMPSGTLSDPEDPSRSEVEPMARAPSTRERQTAIRWDASVDMAELRKQLPATSPATPNIPVTPYAPSARFHPLTPVSAPPTQTEPEISKTTSPTSSTHSRHNSEHRLTMVPSVSTVAATSETRTGGRLTHHRSQPSIRDSVLIRRTEDIAPRPTPEQLERTQLIQSQMSEARRKFRKAAAVAAAAAAFSSHVQSPNQSNGSPSDQTNLQLVDIKVVLNQSSLIKIQVPRDITFDELYTRIEDKFRRCGHGDAVLDGRVLVYRDQKIDGPVVRIESDFTLGVVLFECPERITIFAV
jgi:hypothetical protein